MLYKNWFMQIWSCAWTVLWLDFFVTRGIRTTQIFQCEIFFVFRRPILAVYSQSNHTAKFAGTILYIKLTFSTLFQYNEMIVDPDSDDNAVGPYDVGYSDGSPRMQLCKDFYPDLELKPSTATYTFDGVRDRGTYFQIHEIRVRHFHINKSGRWLEKSSPNTFVSKVWTAAKNPWLYAGNSIYCITRRSEHVHRVPNMSLHAHLPDLRGPVGIWRTLF